MFKPGLRLSVFSRFRHFANVLAALALFASTGCAYKEVVGPSRLEQVSIQMDRNEYYLEVSRREGVVQRAYVLGPPKPDAAVILFMGGYGQVGVSRQGAKSTNFLIRSQDLFVEENLMVVIVDPPSDRSTLEGFRHSEAHAMDLRGVIAEVRKLARVPVWVVGTSNGSASAANIAARLLPPDGPDGVVLTASVEHSRQGNSVFDAPLNKISVPALVVHHKDDLCPHTPFSGAVTLEKALTSAPRRELLTVVGGTNPRGNWCEPHHYHGFIGKEREVVSAIAGWIKK